MNQLKHANLSHSIYYTYKATALLIRNTLLCCICTSTNWISLPVWRYVTVTEGLPECSKHGLSAQNTERGLCTIPKGGTDNTEMNFLLSASRV